MAGYPEGVEVRIILKAFGEFPDDNLFITSVLVSSGESVAKLLCQISYFITSPTVRFMFRRRNR